MVCYRAASSCEPTKAKAYLEDQGVALFRAEDLIRRILRETESDTYSLYIGGTDNFRYEIYPDYKGNRKDTKQPTWYEDVRAFVVQDFNGVIINGRETDDEMGIEQCAAEFMSTVIVTNDKDLLMIPGNHYNPITQTNVFTTPLDSLKYFYQQLIQGDQADNIPGYDGKMRPKIPKFLQPKIDALWDLDNEEEMYELVLNMYDLDASRLVRNARLLWIWRKENDLWQPPDERE